jgi:hypothetical protein
MIPDPNQLQNMPYTSASINSYGADRFGFTSAWVAQNKSKRVTLKQDLVHIQRLINGGALPSTANLAQLNGKPAHVFAQQLSNNFAKILLYFTAKSPIDGKIYNLYITDPCPGSTNWELVGRLPQPQYHIPAYTNVLSHWNVGN